MHVVISFENITSKLCLLQHASSPIPRAWITGIRINHGIIPQNNYIQKGISRRIVSHASLRMLNFLASVMREFYEEIDRKNRIFGRKTDILRKCVAGCAILLNIYGKKDCFDVSSYNWAHKHHFIVRKTKKTYLSDCENSHEKQQTGIFCELKTCFYLPMSG